ncbi:MAG: hypothetical protein KC776_10620 [Myxococcales bacterium]|nr:hypothetical protein [Myxococcales bacterium]MCB9576012.1 hypothetical protein [Polyangiaceae bacterium]
MAVTTDGTIVANVTHVLGEVGDDPKELLAEALAAGRQVFLGVALTASEVHHAKGRLDDAAAEIVATVTRW